MRFSSQLPRDLAEVIGILRFGAHLFGTDGIMEYLQHDLHHDQRLRSSIKHIRDSFIDGIDCGR